MERRCSSLVVQEVPLPLMATVMPGTSLLVIGACGIIRDPGDMGD